MEYLVLIVVLVSLAAAQNNPGNWTVNNPVTGGGLPTGVANGSVLLSNGVSRPGVYQSKPVIDVRDIAGVDCTGTTDSSTALNALTVVDGITRKTLSFRGCPSIRLTSQWLIKGQAFTEIDLGGIFATGGAAQGGTDIFGCSGTADAVIRIDDSGFSYFHGGTIEAKGSSCTSSFVGSIRVTNSQTGGYTSTRNTFNNLFLTSNAGGAAITGYYGFKLDGSPNQEGFGLHHLDVQCQISSGSYGIWVNDQNADSTDLDQESNISGCYQGVRVDAGTFRARNSHIAGNGSYAIYGAGGANFYEGQNGCFQEISNIVSAETSGAFLNGSGSNGIACWRSIHNNAIGFPTIDPALYPIRAAAGTFTMWNNDFGNGGVAVAIHNNAILGDDTNGLTGPSSSVYDLGGNQLSNSGNAVPYLLTFQPTQKQNSFLGPVSTVVNGTTPAAGTSNDWALLPSGAPNSSGNFSYPSSRLIFSHPFYNATAPVMDQFATRNVGDSSATTTTLATTYKSPAGYTITPAIAIQPQVSGLTFSVVAAPAFSPIGSNVTNAGMPGGVTYSYVLVAKGGCGSSAASAAGTTTTGATTLNTTNYNVIHIQATAGAWGFDVYRTVGGATQGKIGTALATDYSGGGTGYLSFNDTGLTGDATTAPVSNTSGCSSLAGNLLFSNGKGQHINTQAASNDIVGTLATSSSTTASVVFTTNYTATPVCVLTPQTTGLTSWYLSAIGTSGFTVTVAPSGTYKFGYHCLGNPN